MSFVANFTIQHYYYYYHCYTIPDAIKLKVDAELSDQKLLKYLLASYLYLVDNALHQNLEKDSTAAFTKVRHDYQERSSKGDTALKCWLTVIVWQTLHHPSASRSLCFGDPSGK